ncbi:Mitochondrial ribosomal protein L51 / S25 / CI-B8 domain [Nakaseomyces glabratus]|nr:54S ribosomal protein, mitochondrial [Nakaseomyces glabratus]
MSKVARQLKFLNKISSTTTDAQVILSPGKYQRLSLTFQTKNHNGHMGARKFWKDYLPTIQFYNPLLRIDVTRIKNESKTVSVPCTLQAIGTDGKVVEEIDMSNKHAPEILQSLLQKLDHERVPESQIISVGTQSA